MTNRLKKPPISPLSSNHSAETIILALDEAESSFRLAGAESATGSESSRGPSEAIPATYFTHGPITQAASSDSPAPHDEKDQNPNSRIIPIGRNGSERGSNAVFVGLGVFHLGLGRVAPSLENRGQPPLGGSAGFVLPGNTVGEGEIDQLLCQSVGHEVEQGVPRVGVDDGAFQSKIAARIR